MRVLYAASISTIIGSPEYFCHLMVYWDGRGDVECNATEMRTGIVLWRGRRKKIMDT
jgi:hypothetical protein